MTWACRPLDKEISTAPRSFYEEAVAVSRMAGNTLALTCHLGALGMVVCEQGNLPAAIQLFREQLDLCREHGLDDNGEGFALVAAAMGAFELAARQYGANEAAAEAGGVNPFGNRSTTRRTNERLPLSVRRSGRRGSRQPGRQVGS